MKMKKKVYITPVIGEYSLNIESELMAESIQFKITGEEMTDDDNEFQSRRHSSWDDTEEEF